MAAQASESSTEEARVSADMNKKVTESNPEILTEAESMQTRTSPKPESRQDGQASTDHTSMSSSMETNTVSASDLSPTEHRTSRSPEARLQTQRRLPSSMRSISYTGPSSTPHKFAIPPRHSSKQSPPSSVHKSSNANMTPVGNLAQQRQIRPFSDSPPKPLPSSLPSIQPSSVLNSHPLLSQPSSSSKSTSLSTKYLQSLATVFSIPNTNSISTPPSPSPTSNTFFNPFSSLFDSSLTITSPVNLIASTFTSRKASVEQSEQDPTSASGSALADGIEDTAMGKSQSAVQSESLNRRQFNLSDSPSNQRNVSNAVEGSSEQKKSGSRPLLRRRTRSYSTSSYKEQFGSDYDSARNGLLNAEDSNPDKAQEKEHINRKYKSPKNAIVLAHGLLGFSEIKVGGVTTLSYWKGIRQALETTGATVLLTTVPATSGVEERARILGEKIAEALPGQTVNLIGHSMGGLDCRFLASHLQSDKFKIASITTLATPHRGSPVADYLINDVIGVSRLPMLLDLLPKVVIGNGAAFEGLTTTAMRSFNEQTPDRPDVAYFSYGADYHPGLIDTWRWSHNLIKSREGENDGLVSVESAKWGKYVRTLENVSHLDVVGQVNTLRYVWAEATGKKIEFHPASFYLECSPAGKIRRLEMTVTRAEAAA